MNQSSFNGLIIPIDRIDPSRFKEEQRLTPVPHTVRMPITKGTKTLYIPENWSNIRPLIKAIIIISLQYAPKLIEEEILMSVITPDEAHHHDEDKHLSISHSDTTAHMVKLCDYKLHPTHNLVITWTNDPTTALAINRML